MSLKNIAIHNQQDVLVIRMARSFWIKAGRLQSQLTGGEETRPRNVAMLYCINATAEPSSGGGEAQPSVSISAKGQGTQSTVIWWNCLFMLMN